ncbi:MAG: PH domain-containing protein [Solirubrobacterales bacterium]
MTDRQEQGQRLGELPERLDPGARWAWRMGGAGAAAVLLGVALPALREGLAESDAPALVSALAQALVVLIAVAGVVVVPEVRWRRWRFAIREHEVDVQHGLLSIERTLVPISRIQHVATGQGPIQRMFGLATVTLHTAAGETSIPQLGEQRAAEVRRQIADLARPDEDRADSAGEPEPGPPAEWRAEEAPTGEAPPDG